jgi:hypothetical protein
VGIVNSICNTLSNIGIWKRRHRPPELRIMNYWSPFKLREKRYSLQDGGYAFLIVCPSSTLPSWSQRPNLLTKYAWFELVIVSVLLLAGLALESICKTLPYLAIGFSWQTIPSSIYSTHPHSPTTYVGSYILRQFSSKVPNTGKVFCQKWAWEQSGKKTG